MKIISPTGYEWPEIFATGDINTREDAALCADALMAWGNCIAGNAPPQKFGEVMAAIGARLGCSMTPEGVMKYAKRKYP